MQRSTGRVSRTRVLLVDQSAFVLEGLRTIIAENPKFLVVGAARTAADALSLVKSRRPHVVVSDVQVGRSSGIELCKLIRESSPDVDVLFFTGSDEHATLKSAILAGAQGYLLKGASGAEILKGIEVVSNGLGMVDPQLTSQVISWIRHQREPDDAKPFVPCATSEWQMLALVAAGTTNKAIARQLNIAPGVLAARLRKLYRRLGLANRSGAARYYAQWNQDAPNR